MSDRSKAYGRKLFEANHAVVEELVRYLSRRNRLSVDEREDFASYATLKLVENDYARLRKYRGDSSFKTYLAVVMQRLFLDYRTQKWGKWRPSTMAKRLGPVAVELETLMYRDGVEFHEAREMMLTGSDAPVTREALWELATRLPRRSRPKELEEEALVNVGVVGEDVIAHNETRAFVEELHTRLSAQTDKFSNEDRLLLKMRFDEQMSVPEIADALHLEAKPLYARIARLLEQYRANLESCGVQWSRLEELFGRRDVGLDLARVLGDAPNRDPVSV